MRTIKFRGKTTKGAWLYGDLEHCVDDGTKMTYIFDDVLSQGGAVLPETVGQFTGLKDKNDNEIYEGDIIHVKGNTFDKDFGVVTYHKNGYFYIDDSFGEFPRGCVKPIGDFFNSISRNDFFQGMEFYVIGNVHDNKDLVKGNNK